MSDAWKAVKQTGQALASDVGRHVKLDLAAKHRPEDLPYEAPGYKAPKPKSPKAPSPPADWYKSYRNRGASKSTGTGASNKSRKRSVRKD